jgi:hypothetical protein
MKKTCRWSCARIQRETRRQKKPKRAHRENDSIILQIPTKHKSFSLAFFKLYVFEKTDQKRGCKKPLSLLFPEKLPQPKKERRRIPWHKAGGANIFRVNAMCASASE